MSQFLQATVSGVLAGCGFGLLGVAYSLVWRVMRILNLALGAVAVLGAFVAYQLHRSYGLDPLAAVVPVAVLLAVGGYPVQRFVINRVVRAPAHVPMLLTMGLGLLLTTVVGAAFPGGDRAVATPYAGRSLVLPGDVRLPVSGLLCAVVAVLSVVTLDQVLRRTRAGRTVRAVAMDRGAARLLGIDVGHRYALTLAVAAGLAGAAGATTVAGTPFSLADVGRLSIVGIAAGVIGGMGRIHGVLAGGVGLGVGLAWLGQLLPASSAGAALLVLVLLGLLARELPHRLRRRVVDGGPA